MAASPIFALQILGFPQKIIDYRLMAMWFCFTKPPGGHWPPLQPLTKQSDEFEFYLSAGRPLGVSHRATTVPL